MKLNLGSGRTKIKGYIPVDRMFGDEVFPLQRHTKKINQYFEYTNLVKDDSCEVIRASHVLEHISKNQSLATIKEWMRCLVPGGLLKIAVPDMGHIVKNPGHPHFEGWIVGGQTDDNDYHKSIWFYSKLYNLMVEAGLVDITFWKSEIEDCASLPVSLNLQGRKRTSADKTMENTTVAAIMSSPRVGFTENAQCIHDALHGIPIQIYSQGPWWEKGLDQLLAIGLDHGTDLICTLDYDTVFERKDFEMLYSIMVANPYIDALSCLQSRRGHGNAMLTLTDNKTGSMQMPYGGAVPIKCKTAHFGLTFIRVQKLKKMSLPWFKNTPGKSGHFRQAEEGNIDADIHFWLEWAKAGNSLYVHPATRVGHMEIMVSLPNPETGNATHYYLEDWKAQSNPVDSRYKTAEVKPVEVANTK